MKEFYQQDRERIYVIGGLIGILLFVSPLFILGENAHIRVHDNLDSNLAWYKVLANSGEMFGGLTSTIPQIINGLPRDAFGSEWTGIVWLHALFPSMTAYAISMLITRIFAFLGMYLLLKNYVVKNDKAVMIRVGVALLFAITPVWPSGMLSTLGHPLALWAFLNIRRKDYSWKNWLTLGLLPLYSSFVLGFFFFLVAIGFLWLYDLIKSKKWNLPFLGSIAFMTFLFVLVEYRLFYSMVVEQEPNHRTEFYLSKNNLMETIQLSFKNFFIGHTHDLTIHDIVIMPVLIGVLLLVIFQKQKGRLEKLYISLFSFNYLLSLWYAFWWYEGWVPLKEKSELLNTFNFSRFHFLSPIVIYVSFALACYLLWRLGKVWIKLVPIILVAQLFVLLPYNEEYRYGIEHPSPSFKEFFAEEQFEDIKEYIGLPLETYRVASIGIHPAISQYNGFYTVDTYNNLYPLTYKHAFRKIIEKELAKNKVLREYFDDWGGRLYIFVDELGKKYDYKKNSKKVIQHLELNTEAFKELGGRYFLSAVPILNNEENNLVFKKAFEHPDSAWKIYLYEVK